MNVLPLSFQPSKREVDSSFELYIKRLKEPDPLTTEHINDLYLTLFQSSGESKTSDCLFDKTHSLSSVAYRLYRAVFFGKMKEETNLSTNEGKYVIDKETNMVLFFAKGPHLKENLGVQKNEAIEREHLYYLLDQGRFAGVPATFHVKKSLSERYSFNWYVENCYWLSNRQFAEKKVSLRKCVIHQFRTVNMDPSIPNILVPQGGSDAFPIDGGYCLPSSLSDERRPFSIPTDQPLVEKPYLDEPFTEEELLYIQNINIENDKELISNHLKKGYKIQSVLKIFEVANRILKKATEEQLKKAPNEVSITLHDICHIRDLRSNKNFPRKSIFEYILEGLNEDDIVKRIDFTFSEIRRIKTAILMNDNKTPEKLALELLETFDKTNFVMKKLAAYYIFGEKVYYEYLEGQETEIKTLLKSI